MPKRLIGPETDVFVSPQERYEGIALLVRDGKLDEALRRPELSWLNNDLGSWVDSALNSPQTFNSALVRGLDALDGMTPDDSSLEARIYQRWSAFPQIEVMISSTHLPRHVFETKIKELIQQRLDIPDQPYK